MPEKRSRVQARYVVSGIALLIALMVAWPVYLEVATRSAFNSGELRTVPDATVVRTESSSGHNMSQNWSELEIEVSLPDGTRYVVHSDSHDLWPEEGDTVRAGLFGDELVSLNGHYARGMLFFRYYVLLMALAGTTVCAAVMFIRRRSKAPQELLLETGFVSWFAVWAFLPIGIVLDTAFDSPWWPVIGWAGSVALLLAIFMRKYVRVHRTQRKELAAPKSHDVPKPTGDGADADSGATT
jgi:hypothetical protein